MKKTTIFNLTVIFIGLVGSMFSCSSKSLYKAAYGNAPICLAYPVEEGVIRNQSEIASIVVNNDFGLTIDSIKILSPGSKFDKKLRSANDGTLRHVRVVDVLPGKHELTVKYSSTYHQVSTSKPITIEVSLEAGNVYLLQIETSSLTRMSFLGEKSGNTYGIKLIPIPDDAKQMIIDCRNRSSFE